MPNPDGSPASDRDGPPRWMTITAAGAAVAAGVLAAYSPAWAIGVGTGAALFAAIREVFRR